MSACDVTVQNAHAPPEDTSHDTKDSYDEDMKHVFDQFLECRFIHFIWNKEELPQQWKEFIIVPIHEKGDKADCNNY
jgi:hypothetical protein